MRADHQLIKCDKVLLEGQRRKIRKGHVREGRMCGGEKEQRMDGGGLV